MFNDGNNESITNENRNRIKSLFERVDSRFNIGVAQTIGWNRHDSGAQNVVVATDVFDEVDLVDVVLEKIFNDSVLKGREERLERRFEFGFLILAKLNAVFVV